MMNHYSYTGNQRAGSQLLAIGGLCMRQQQPGPGKGKVYYLNFKPEALDQWKKDRAETHQGDRC